MNGEKEKTKIKKIKQKNKGRKKIKVKKIRNYGKNINYKKICLRVKKYVCSN
jgi:hypothetical protein